MKFEDCKIIGYMQPTSGVHYHRIALPISGLKLEKSLITNDVRLILERIKTGQCDILLYNRFIPDLPWYQLEKLRDQYGFKIVVDNDDYWNLYPSHILYQAYKDGMAGAIVENIRIADMVTTTHHRLARQIQPLNNLVFVLPNALPYDRDQFTDEKTESPDGLLRLGYVGGATHMEDLEILRGPFKKMAADPFLSARVQTNLFGYNQHNKDSARVWTRMATTFTAGGKLKHMAYDPLDVQQYMAAYTVIDLAMVPLVDNTFNGYKSNLKLLEAGVKYTPVICSKVLPYWEGLPVPGVYFVESQKDWVKYIRQAVKDPEQFKEAGLKLGDWVRRNFHLDRWTIVRQQLFTFMLNQDSRPKENHLKVV